MYRTQTPVVNRIRLNVPPQPTELLMRLPNEKGRFLLESGGGPADIARYSFLSCRPFLEFSCRGPNYELRRQGLVQSGTGDPLKVLDSLLREYHIPSQPGMPPFIGGAVGYFGYDLGRLLETIPDRVENDLDLPDLQVAFYDAVVTVDHETSEVCLFSCAIEGHAGETEERTTRLAEWLTNEQPAPASEPSQAGTGAPVAITSNFARSEYLTAIQRAIDYIYAGDIYQVNLSQRFSATLPFSSLELWTRLRRVNPAPFSAYLDYGSFQVVCASPERFLALTPAKVDPTGEVPTWRVETRPIKGTRRRGDTPERDAELRNELAQSLKDRAELNMIVDLERNDIGRVCEFGTVVVPDSRRIEAYPTVFHTVATVEGLLRPGITTGDLLRATFPGGSITGAPKVRAMEIIEELETVRRHVYTGSVGYIGFQGTMDLNIVIRTFVVKDGVVYFHAGGGIVADSRPEDEYDETITKAAALMRALGVADVHVVEKGK